MQNIPKFNDGADMGFNVTSMKIGNISKE
jgi:hypothetical protein